MEKVAFPVDKGISNWLKNIYYGLHKKASNSKNVTYYCSKIQTREYFIILLNYLLLISLKRLN